MGSKNSTPIFPKLNIERHSCSDRSLFQQGFNSLGVFPQDMVKSDTNDNTGFIRLFKEGLCPFQRGWADRLFQLEEAGSLLQRLKGESETDIGWGSQEDQDITAARGLIDRHQSYMVIPAAVTGRVD